LVSLPDLVSPDFDSPASFAAGFDASLSAFCADLYESER
jgi:hypothetical protein